MAPSRYPLASLLLVLYLTLFEILDLYSLSAKFVSVPAMDPFLLPEKGRADGLVSGLFAAPPVVLYAAMAFLIKLLFSSSPLRFEPDI